MDIYALEVSSNPIFDDEHRLGSSAWTAAGMSSTARIESFQVNMDWRDMGTTREQTEMSDMQT